MGIRSVQIRSREKKIATPALRGFFLGLAGPVGNPALTEIVGRQLYGHLVAAQNSNIVFSHLAGDMRGHNVSVFQFDAELRIRQVLKNGAFHFDMFLFCHAVSWASAR